eukprot:CAMPEP_0179006480 /NCGR_PEP_ID=MMETSP0795-20121207/14575_1 /TAXON_ID=88552 /ORGANISM="Amoebophrya sp., Strain Ameob2" /LENGTH=91 /DNA_ID=CAMNT_0020701241 /DNA_START=219 /DNA_END=490 /DNA_ORIENTATION=+
MLAAGGPLSSSSLHPGRSSPCSSPPPPVPDVEKKLSASMSTSMPTWGEVGPWSLALTLSEAVENAETPKTEAPPEDHAQLLSLATPPSPTP